MDLAGAVREGTRIAECTQTSEESKEEGILAAEVRAACLRCLMWGDPARGVEE